MVSRPWNVFERGLIIAKSLLVIKYLIRVISDRCMKEGDLEWILIPDSYSQG